MAKEYTAEIVIVGGSLGGCAAAIGAAKIGKNVILTEETAWIGGQLTNQGVPPDEHPWIEEYGCTGLYRTFRNKVRDYYKRNFPLYEHAMETERLNPGSAIVSKLSHEPRTALAVLYEMMAPYIHNGRLQILSKHKLEAAYVDGDDVRTVTVQDLETGERRHIHGIYFLDATDIGELLPLSGTEYVTGAESQSQTGEPHALEGEADPLDMQAVTHVFAIDYVEGEDYTIVKPDQYEFWKEYKPDFWPVKLLHWDGVYPHNHERRTFSLFPDGKHFSLWEYRRIIDEKHFLPGTQFQDITTVNWQQNDYFLGTVFEVDEKSREKHLEAARQLSLSLLYWMQTEAPRRGGGYGYPGLRLRPDILGTQDGLAMKPYIRESRRIKAEFTVLEQHISKEIRGNLGAEKFRDSVGIGSYGVDLHPSTGNRHYIDFAGLPFQIPLGSMIPIRMNNLIPACKNIGVTHITNGCYRLHPVEWNIGEVAGYLAAYAIEKQTTPRQVYENESILEDFQRLLTNNGVQLEWPVHH
ncbi:FAD-dependent oxidoreductase [Alkalihalobacillus sp. TS-13]|uniref:FAD-dependent oxidoreductase n=1 Tax=Alkalihalobacillus sp. TS-13 TaxID=2842455 RepID=UPI001C88ABC0|nr:FAD-dependent oxidoreductase [Alkalihalobacillus sp. TS-13]